MKQQKGFTLIELMVVIVIIGILSALAVPKMFGTSAKAKAAEAPGMISHWETLQSAYAQESGQAECFSKIGFTQPTSKWFGYTDALDCTAPAATSKITATALLTFGDCATNDTFESDFTAATDNAVHGSTGTCATTYGVNF